MTIPPPRPPKPTVHGWLILDKPVGLTSTQALGKTRRLLEGRKAGHGGTLDPLATGVLPLAFGEATKLIPWIMEDRKEYEFAIRWGEQRATDDAEGEVVATSDQRPAPEAIRAALPAFTGSFLQKPPSFSAIKVEGQRAYDLARDGAPPDLPSRPVVIHELTLLDTPDAATARLRVRCGKGMYVRSLARDLALALGTVGHVAALRRTRVGPFTIEKAISLEKLGELAHKGEAHKALLGVGAALDDIPGLALTPAEAQRLRAGQPLLIRPQHLDLLEAPVILASLQEVPVALVEARSGAFHVRRGFHF